MTCLLSAFAAPCLAQGEPHQVLTPQVSGAPTVRLFGFAVDRLGTRLAVGAPGSTNFNITTEPAGAVFVYQRQLNATWSIDTVVQAPTVVTDDSFGYAVEQTSNQLIVGAPFSNAGGANRGRVYAYTRQGAGYSAPQAIQSGVAINNNAQFGGSLSQDAGWLAVGAIGAGIGGHVQLFRYDGDFEAWVYHSVIDSQAPQNGGAFGANVLLRGDRLFISASGEAGAAGFVAEYQRSGLGAAATWSLRQRFRPSGVPGLDRFGNSLDLSADAATLVVGASFQGDSGRAYVFSRNGMGDWAESGNFNDRPSIVNSFSYASTTRFDGNVLFVSDVGARLTGSPSRPGNLYRLRISAGPVFNLERDYARAGADNDLYGQDFAVAGGELAIGAPGVDATGNMDEGRVYVRVDTGLNEAPGLIFSQAQNLTQGEQTPGATVLGQVIDLESPSGTIAVTTTPGGSATGVGASALSISGDDLRGTLSASCAATSGTLRFRAKDGLATGDYDLTVNVSANPAPSLSYAGVSANQGSATTVSPSSGPSDNGSISTIAVLSAGSFTGGVSVNSSTGVVSLTNASPAGSHTITISATDNCGATRNAAFNVQVIGNAPPVFTPGAAISRRQASPPGAAVAIGTVSDLETAAAALQVAAAAGGTASGVSISGVINSNGTVLAQLAASCFAATGTVRISVSDGTSTVFGSIQVNVLPNTPPTLAYSGVSVNAGSATSAAPSSGPADNGTLDTITLLSSGSFAGGVTVNPGTGVVSLSNASPPGTHTITIRATDTCGEPVDAGLVVQVVGNAPPEFTPGAAISRRQGSPPGAAVAVGTVSDAETAAAALQVAAAAGGTATGVTIAGVSNSNGTVLAQLSANCTATSGTVRVSVSDGTSSMFGNIQVNVLSNTPPALGSYPDQLYVQGSSGSIAPSSAISDNGSLGTPIVEVAPTSYTGSASVVATGTVTLGNVGPIGTYTVGVQAIDTCGAATLRSFDVEVRGADVFIDGFE